MADVDLFRDAYRTSLGREASEEELQGWTTGQYGGGSVQDRLNQISQSGEAQAYQGSQAPVIGPSPGEYSSQPVNFEMHAPQQSQPQGFDQVAQWYEQLLGRQGSSDEINNWLGGSYGWGNSGNLQGIYQGILGSGESRAYAPVIGQNPNVSGPATGAPYQNFDWWSSQGVNQNDIFDPATGQLRAGWARTGQGYERSGAQQQIPGPKNGDYQNWFAQLTGGKPPTPEELERLAPILSQYGIKIGSKGDRGWSDTLILPNGQMIDVIEAAGIGSGKKWQWTVAGGGGGGYGTPGNQYSDPYTQLLEQLLKGRLGSLMQPVQDPNRAAYEAMLQQRAAALGQMTPELNKQIGYLEERFKDLQGTGYTGAEGEAIRTGALDPIETDRQAARKRVTERLSARGITLDSGIAQQALLEVDKAFDAMRGTTQTALTTNDLNRREDRKGRAETIRGTLAQIPEGRAREQLDVYSALQQLSLLARQEDEARQREAMGYGGMLADLGPQRLQLAMQAAGMGGNPSSSFQNLMQLAGLNQNAALYGAQGQQSLWSGLGSIAAMLAGAGR